MAWLIRIFFLSIFLKVSQSSFHVVHNTSLPCEALRSIHPDYKVEEWTRNEKLKYLKYYDLGILAENEEQAKENFRDLINSKGTLDSLSEMSGISIAKKSDIVSALKAIQSKKETFEELSLQSDKITDYCRPRGEERDGFLYLCTECAGTQRLDSSKYWPYILNEAYCDEKDRACISHGSTNHGQCFSTLGSVNLLKKKEGYCTLVLKGGRTVIMHTWRREMTAIRVGCGCLVDKLSFLANYIPKPKPKPN